MITGTPFRGRSKKLIDFESDKTNKTQFHLEGELLLTTIHLPKAQVLKRRGMSVNYIVSPDPREMFQKFSSFLCRLSFNWKLQLPSSTGRNCRSQFQVSQIWPSDHKLNRALHKYLINSNYTGVVAMSSRKEHCQSDRECPFRVIVASRNVNGGRCWWNIANSHQIDCVEGPLNWPNNLVIELFRTDCVDTAR